MKRWKVCVLCAVCVVCVGLLTGCGAREQKGTVNTERNTGTLSSERVGDNSVTDRTMSESESGTNRLEGSNDVNDGVNDATGDEITERNEMPGDDQSGVGNAVEDLADGVGNAGKDIVDGIEDAGDSLMGNDRTEQTDNKNELTDRE